MTYRFKPTIGTTLDNNPGQTRGKNSDNLQILTQTLYIQALNAGQLSFLGKICGAVPDLHQPGVWAEIFGQNISGIHRSWIMI